MPLGTLDRTPPPFFRQGPSALTKLALFSALALFLMAADNRFQMVRPVRAALATVLYPLQWVVIQPLRLASFAGHYLESLDSARTDIATARQRLVTQSRRANQVEQLTLENSRLRQLLGLREQLAGEVQAAEVLYDAADPYTRKIIVDRGASHGVLDGSPVIDEHGVVGQVTRAYPWVSEVTLLTDRDQAIPVLNTRTGARSLAFGDPGSPAGPLELRFVAATADVQEGDLLTTSGVDGVYPPGLAVARVAKVERRADSPFARIRCLPVALTEGTRQVLVLRPVAAQLPARPAPEAPAAPAKKGERK
jgi:rod shape-determining protein MreC